MDKPISTGIEALDKMLCGNGSPQDDGAKGIPRKSIVLIRGEPGTGKTTLAMQILSNFLSEPADKPDKEKKNVRYFFRTKKTRRTC